MCLSKKTLTKQVIENCKKHFGWDDRSAKDAAALAVEICGSDSPCNERDLNDVLAEVCRVG